MKITIFSAHLCGAFIIDPYMYRVTQKKGGLIYNFKVMELGQKLLILNTSKNKITALTALFFWFLKSSKILILCYGTFWGVTRYNCSCVCVSYIFMNVSIILKILFISNVHTVCSIQFYNTCYVYLWLSIYNTCYAWGHFPDILIQKVILLSSFIKTLSSTICVRGVENTSK